jgi:hypothetical protein
MSFAVARLPQPAQRVWRHAKARGISNATFAEGVVSVVEPRRVKFLAREVEIVVANADHEGQGVKGGK